MQVTEIAIYPIKSTRQITLQEAKVSATGFAHDRSWVLADLDGHFITQRNYPQLVRVTATPVAGGLLLQAPDKVDCFIAEPQTASEKTARVSVWKDDCEALDAGEDAAQWFSGFLNIPCRLYFQPPSAVRQVDSRYARAGDRTGFADGFPFLLTSEGSLADLNHRLATPLSMARFRPNIVIDNDVAFAEDHWQVIQIGKVRFRVVKSCTRCVMTTVNPDTGVKEGKEPLTTLAGYRKTEKGIIFGRNLIHDHMGTIRVGDKVEVIC